MDADASERRKIKIYAGQKKNAMKKFPQWLMPNWNAVMEVLEQRNFYLQIMCL